MSKIIRLSNIIQDVRKQPWNMSSVQFMQASFLEQFNDVGKSLIIAARDNTDFTDKLVVLWGVAITGIGEENTEGAIYRNGVFYRVVAQGPLAAPTGGDVFVYALLQTPDASDPQKFSDGLLFDSLIDNTIRIVAAAPGSGFADVIGDPLVVDLPTKANLAQGAYQNVTFLDSDWFALTNRMQIRKNDTGLVHLRGVMIRQNTPISSNQHDPITLPDSSFRPNQLVVAPVILRGEFEVDLEVSLNMVIHSGEDPITLLNNSGVTIGTTDEISINIMYFAS